MLAYSSVICCNLSLLYSLIFLVIFHKFPKSKFNNLYYNDEIKVINIIFKLLCSRLNHAVFNSNKP